MYYMWINKEFFASSWTSTKVILWCTVSQSSRIDNKYFINSSMQLLTFRVSYVIVTFNMSVEGTAIFWQHCVCITQARLIIHKTWTIRRGCITLKCAISRLRSRGYNIVLPYLTEILRSEHTAQLRFLWPAKLTATINPNNGDTPSS